LNEAAVKPRSVTDANVLHDIVDAARDMAQKIESASGELAQAKELTAEAEDEKIHDDEKQRAARQHDLEAGEQRLRQQRVREAQNMVRSRAQHEKRAQQQVKSAQTSLQKVDKQVDQARQAVAQKPESESTQRNMEQATARQSEAVNTAFQHLCDRLDGEPRVLCHRDYHTRNLLVAGDGRVVAIDHQDARRGPDTYDLASLLYDPYVDQQEPRTQECIRQFRQARDLKEPEEVFGERLDAVAAQRLLKAAGTFAAQKMLHDRSSYLAYLPAALTRARAALQRHDTHADLLAALTPLLPEWSRQA
jgi:aminoglycoside/choline kinase family phosphotransferase